MVMNKIYLRAGLLWTINAIHINFYGGDGTRLCREWWYVFEINVS